MKLIFERAKQIARRIIEPLWHPTVLAVIIKWLLDP